MQNDLILGEEEDKSRRWTNKEKRGKKKKSNALSPQEKKTKTNKNNNQKLKKPVGGLVRQLHWNTFNSKSGKESSQTRLNPPN